MLYKTYVIFIPIFLRSKYFVFPLRWGDSVVIMQLNLAGVEANSWWWKPQHGQVEGILNYFLSWIIYSLFILLHADMVFVFSLGTINDKGSYIKLVPTINMENLQWERCMIYLHKCVNVETICMGEIQHLTHIIFSYMYFILSVIFSYMYLIL